MTKPLEPDDQQRLTVAEGYAALSMWLDANAELEEIDPEVRHVPEVLEVRLAIYSGLEKWDLMEVVASKLADYDPTEPLWPVSWAFAARRTQGLEAAKQILLAAVERHPHAPITASNKSRLEVG